MKHEIIPQRTVKTFEAGNYRVNLRRSSHRKSDPYRWSIAVWSGWNVQEVELRKDITEEIAIEAFESAKQEVINRIAMLAFNIKEQK